jgi:AcrR family transcriptional regulator
VARYQAGIRTERRIVEATRELLGEVGLEGTTLKAICDRAEVRAGSFYNLFESKEEVVLRVVREAIRAVDPDPSGVGQETLADLVEAYIAFITEESTLARVYLKIAISGAVNDDGLGARVARHHRRRSQRFSEAMAKEHPELTGEEVAAHTEVLLAALNGLAFAWLVHPDLDFRRHALLAAGLDSSVGHNG